MSLALWCWISFRLSLSSYLVAYSLVYIREKSEIELSKLKHAVKLHIFEFMFGLEPYVFKRVSHAGVAAGTGKRIVRLNI